MSVVHAFAKRSVAPTSHVASVPGPIPYPAVTQRWNAEYAVEGLFTVHRGLFSAPFSPPARMTSTYHPEQRILSFFGTKDWGTDDGYGLGMMLELESADGASVTSITITSPMRGGTVTDSFPLAGPVKWLSLSVGEASETFTRDRIYVVSVTRDATSRWSIRILPRDPDHVHPWLTEGSFSITTDRPSPPWKTIRIDLSSRNSAASTEGELVLTRRSSEKQ